MLILVPRYRLLTSSEAAPETGAEIGISIDESRSATTTSNTGITCDEPKPWSRFAHFFYVRILEFMCAVGLLTSLRHDKSFETAPRAQALFALGGCGALLLPSLAPCQYAAAVHSLCFGHSKTASLVVFFAELARPTECLERRTQWQRQRAV